MWQRCRSHSGIRGEAGSRSVARVPKPQCGGGTELLQTGFSPRSGGDGIRTHCLYIANVALYQLSYTPEGVITLAQCSPRYRIAAPRVIGLLFVVVALVNFTISHRAKLLDRGQFLTISTKWQRRLV